MNEVTVTGTSKSIAVEKGNVVEIAQTANTVTVADGNAITVQQTNNTVSLQNVQNNVEVLSTNIDVVSVGTQGPQGPSGATVIGGKAVPTTAPTDGHFITFDASSDEFVFTLEIDAGTY